MNRLLILRASLRRILTQTGVIGAGIFALSLVLSALLPAPTVLAAAKVAARPTSGGFSIAYVQTVTTTNILGNGTELSDHVTLGNPNAIIFVTPNRNPAGVTGVVDNHHLGVRYNGVQWAIFNQDNTAMPVGASFNVYALFSRIVAAPGPIHASGGGLVSAYVQTATTANIAGNATALSDGTTPGDPNAIIIVTPNWNPNGGVGVFDNHPLGVRYKGGQWTIFNADGKAMPVGASFNVYALPTATVLGDVFVQTATPSNSHSNYTTINSLYTNGQSNFKLLVTPNWNPKGTAGVVDNHSFGVRYHNGKWIIFNADGKAMPVGASFNIVVVV